MREDLGRSINSCHEKLDDQKAMIDRLQLQLTNCIEGQEVLKAKNSALEKENLKMKEYVQRLEQDFKSNSILIHGIPLPARVNNGKRPQENLVDVVHRIGKAIDFKFNPTTIDSCHRVGNGKDNAADNPPPILVKFTSRMEKQEFFRQKKARSKLSTNRIFGYEQVDQPVYVCDDLTEENRILLSKAKRYGKAKGYRYVWWSNGKVLMRKRAGSKVFVVSPDTDFDLIFDEPPTDSNENIGSPLIQPEINLPTGNNGTIEHETSEETTHNTSNE